MRHDANTPSRFLDHARELRSNTRLQAHYLFFFNERHRSIFFSFAECAAAMRRNVVKILSSPFFVRAPISCLVFSRYAEHFDVAMLNLCPLHQRIIGLFARSHDSKSQSMAQAYHCITRGCSVRSCNGAARYMELSLKRNNYNKEY